MEAVHERFPVRAGDNDAGPALFIFGQAVAGLNGRGLQLRHILVVSS
jgi:hypothetical protein